jgi:deoxyribonuclease V
MNRLIYPYDINIILSDLQNKLADQIIREDVTRNLETVAGVDVSFSSNSSAVVAAVSIDLNSLNIVEQAFREVELYFPYIPGLLGFREAEAMVSVLYDLEEGFDAVMVNGHGILHPRSFGLASQVGLLIDKPTLGLAKSLTSGIYILQDVRLNGKLIKLVFHGERVIGAYLNGYYLSVGHKISLKSAIKIVENTSTYRTPESLRQAHLLATETFKEIIKKKFV